MSALLCPSPSAATLAAAAGAAPIASLGSVFGPYMPAPAAAPNSTSPYIQAPAPTSAPKPAATLAPQPTHTAPAQPAPRPGPTTPGWTHSPELRAFTQPLIDANLNLIAHRMEGLRLLHEFCMPDSGLPIDQVRSCGTILTLPYLRISKKVRTNLINADFVAAGREYNRVLVDTKAFISIRLSEIAKDEDIDPAVRRLASATKARSTAHQRVEHAELLNCELPESLLPPNPEDEPNWMSQQWVPPAMSQSEPIAAPTQAAAHVPPSTATRPNGGSGSSASAPTTATTTTPAAPAAPTTSVPITTPTKTQSSESQPQPSTTTTPTTQTLPPIHRLGGKPFGMPGAKRGPFKKRRA